MQLIDLKGEFRPNINDLQRFCCSCTMVGGVAPAHEKIGATPYKSMTCEIGDGMQVIDFIRLILESACPAGSSDHGFLYLLFLVDAFLLFLFLRN
jgi:hypothetical protein